MDNGNLFLEIKSVGEDGTFTGIASVYGVEDLGGDIIEKGAFTKTLQENPEVPVLWQHDSTEVIGMGRVSEQGNRVMLEGRLDLEDATAQKAHRKMRQRLVKGLSIGFMAIKRTFAEESGRYLRRIQELKLMEVSVVTFPMLPAAQITSVKQREELVQRVAQLEAQLSALEAKQTPPAATATPEPEVNHSAILAIAAATARIAAL